MQVFLWRNAKVVEPGGTITRGDCLLVTLNTFGTVERELPGAGDPLCGGYALYRRASRARRTRSIEDERFHHRSAVASPADP